MMNVEVFIESLGETRMIEMTEAQLSRAQNDGNFLAMLVQQYLDSSTEPEEAGAQVPSAETSNESINQVKDLADTSNDARNASLFIWNNACVHLLLTLYEEDKESFSSGTTRHKKLWENIAKRIQKENEAYVVTGLQCQTKINGLKKTYKKIKDHNKTSGNDRATWPFLHRMDEIFGHSGWVEPVAVASEAGPSKPTGTVEPATKKAKSAVYDTYLKDIVEDSHTRRIEQKKRDQKADERFDKLYSLKEQQHKEKMEVMRDLCNALITINN